MNSIHAIAPYRFHGLWAFDDPSVGLEREPFVENAGAMLDRQLAQRGISEPFTMLFSAGPFPGADITLEWRRASMGGDIYGWQDCEAWLCPALLKYFNTAPAQIYVQLRQA
jgi:hypothetical protein